MLHLPSEKDAHLENCHRYWKAKCKEAQAKCLLLSVCPYCEKKYVLLIMNEIFLDLSRKLTNYNNFRTRLINDIYHFETCALRWKYKYELLAKAKLKP